MATKPDKTVPHKPKYQALFESLRADILSKRFKTGQKMPSEAALVKRSGASRITVGRALRELQNQGLIDRIGGSGTYVRDLATNDTRPLLFGLLIPDLGETEIFEPICQSIASANEQRDHALLWGHADATISKTMQALRLCQQYISHSVSGVFFAPLEFENDAEKVNKRILSELKQAQIPVVLLDRRASQSPERHRPDLVGLNNRQAGYVATDHLIQMGCRRIGFIGHQVSAFILAERRAGYEEALIAQGLRPAVDYAMRMSQGREGAIEWTDTKNLDSVDAFVCINDRMAAQLMHAFLATGVRIPDDVCIVGIDDVGYAHLLPVPLTTVRQPTREIGEAALHTMLDRIRMPHMPPRELLLDGELVVRKSCGS